MEDVLVCFRAILLDGAFGGRWDGALIGGMFDLLSKGARQPQRARKRIERKRNPTRRHDDGNPRVRSLGRITSCGVLGPASFGITEILSCLARRRWRETGPQQFHQVFTRGVA